LIKFAFTFDKTNQDLEVAVYGLQRQLDIEVQLVKCFEYLTEMNW
ncbi:hypothetical protein AC249_AIPGENE29266, partial [Exaiptasia diaphana]